MMTTNVFVIGNVKQLRTGGSFRILLSFFRASWGVGFLNSAVFNSFQIGLSLTRILRALRISGEGVEPPQTTPFGTTVCMDVLEKKKTLVCSSRDVISGHSSPGPSHNTDCASLTPVL